MKKAQNFEAENLFDRKTVHNQQIAKEKSSIEADFKLLIQIASNSKGTIEGSHVKHIILIIFSFGLASKLKKLSSISPLAPARAKIFG
jgi:hypothetical protein